MNILCWNCRGLGNPWSVRQLRRWSNFYAPDIMFISETMISKNNVEALKGSLGFQNAFGVASRGRGGGLCLFWREEVLFSLVSFSQHHICGDVEDGNKKWRFVGIYRWAKEEEKHHTWELIHYLCGEALDLPILLGGDFNEILSHEEKEGGSYRVRREMGNFRATLDALSLKDLGYVGVWYTWERGLSSATRIRERVDRFISSPSWTDLYPNSATEHTLRYKSDHSAIVLRPAQYHRPKGRSKRIFFETAWLLDENCEPEVVSAWAGSAGGSLPDRISCVAQSLVRWSGSKFGHIGKKIEKAEKELKWAQQQVISEENCKFSAACEKSSMIFIPSMRLFGIYVLGWRRCVMGIETLNIFTTKQHSGESGIL